MTITLQSLSSLILHPALECLPPPGEDDATSRAIVASVCELRRILDPLKVSKGRVVDGRLRMRGAKAAGIEVVPTVEVPDGDIHTTILHALCARRNLSKGALAYVAIPLIENAHAEYYKRSQKERESFLSGSGSESHRDSKIKKRDEIAEDMGISKATYYRGLDVRRSLEEHPEFRGFWEPRILAGELSLEKVKQGLFLQVKAARAGGKRNWVQGELDLWKEKLSPLLNGQKFRTWKQASYDTRKFMAEEVATAVCEQWPEELRETIFQRLKKQRKEAVWQWPDSQK